MKIFKRSLKADEHGIAAAVGGVIAVLVSISIGILVYYKVIVSIGGGGSAAQVTALAGVNTTAQTVFTLAPIVGIVMIAGIILAVVMGFGRQNA